MIYSTSRLLLSLRQRLLVTKYKGSEFDHQLPYEAVFSWVGSLVHCKSMTWCMFPKKKTLHLQDIIYLVHELYGYCDRCYKMAAARGAYRSAAASSRLTGWHHHFWRLSCTYSTNKVCGVYTVAGFRAVPLCQTGLGWTQRWNQQENNGISTCSLHPSDPLSIQTHLATIDWWMIRL